MFSVDFKHHTPQPSTICTKNSMKEEPNIFFITTIGTAKTKCVSHPRLKPNGWIMIVQSILQVGVNSVDSTEFTGPVEYPFVFLFSNNLTGNTFFSATGGSAIHVEYVDFVPELGIGLAISESHSISIP